MRVGSVLYWDSDKLSAEALGLLYLVQVSIPQIPGVFFASIQCKNAGNCPKLQKMSYESIEIRHPLYIYTGVLFPKAHWSTSRKPQHREQTLIWLALIELQLMLATVRCSLPCRSLMYGSLVARTRVPSEGYVDRQNFPPTADESYDSKSFAHSFVTMQLQGKYEIMRQCPFPTALRGVFQVQITRSSYMNSKKRHISNTKALVV